MNLKKTTLIVAVLAILLLFGFFAYLKYPNAVPSKTNAIAPTIVGEKEKASTLPVAPSVSPASTLFESFDKITNQREAIKFIDAEIENSRVHGKDFDRTSILLLCDRLSAKWPELVPSAHDLTARCYAASGNQDAALGATLAYAEAAADRDHRDAKERAKLSEAEIEASANERGASKLVQAGHKLIEHSPAAAIPYLQLVVKNYPHTYQAECSYSSLAKCFERTKNIDAARATLKFGIESIKNQNVLSECYEDLARLELDAGNKEKAIAVLEAMKAKFNTPERDEYCAYKTAKFQLANGKTGRVDAIAALEAFVTKYPNSRYVKDAKECIDVLRLHETIHGAAVPPAPPKGTF